MQPYQPLMTSQLRQCRNDNALFCCHGVTTIVTSSVR